MDHTYWLKQTTEKPLFPDIEWSKPERKDQAGALAIIGGNKLGFAAAAEAYQTALETGVGAAKVLLPDCLKKSIPASMVDVVFAPCNVSGSLNNDSVPALQAIADWADGILLIGDAGRSSETSVVYEKFLQNYDGQLTITRDAVDLVKNNPSLIVERKNTCIVASFAQVQKLFQGMYYPKMLAFSMQLMQLVEALHKFTITYPSTIMTLHKDTLIIASNGKVVTQPWQEPMAIWRGTVATKAACYWLWNPDLPLESASASV